MRKDETGNITETTPATDLPQEATTSNNKPTRAPKARSVLDLETASPESMTRQEAVKYIKYLRAENKAAQAKITAVEENTKGAFEKVRYYENVIKMIEEVNNKERAFTLSSLYNLTTALENMDAATTLKINSIKGGF